MEKNNKKITEKFKGAGKTAAINTKLYSAKMYKKSPALVWVVLLLAIGGGAFAYLKNNETKKETHLVSRGPIEEVVKVTLTKPNMTPYRCEITVNEALSVSDFENGFVIYPNPAKDIINIKSNRTDLGFASVKLFDLNGRMLAKYDNVSLDSDYSIPVQNLLSGIYVLSIQNGDFHKNQKIVVK